MVNESKTQRRKIKKTLTLHWNKKKKKEIEIQRHDDEFLEYLGKKTNKKALILRTSRFKVDSIRGLVKNFLLIVVLPELPPNLCQNVKK